MTQANKKIFNGLKPKNILKSMASSVLVIAITFIIVKAGDLFPTGNTVAPSLYTLGDIYNKLTDNTSFHDEGDHNLDSSGTPESTFYTLKQIYEAIPTLDASKIATGTLYMGVMGTMNPSTPLKTGQTKCYDPSGNTTNEIPCPGTGQDGEYQKGQAISYTDNGDGTVTDNSTGLMWKKCREGLTGANCEIGSATTTNWINSISKCENDTTAGYDDWRLPNIKELLSIVDYGKVDPAIDTTIFPETVSDADWSSTTYSVYPVYAWFVDFYDGITSYGNKDGAYYVRCAR